MRSNPSRRSSRPPAPLSMRLLLSLLLLSATTSARAQVYRYEVQVEGMVCAYCAYNVSQRFGRLEGVEAGSVDVDLAAKRVRFHSRTNLPDAVIENTLTDSGFSVKTIERETLREIGGQEATGVQQAQVSLPVAALDSELAERLLDALGAAAVALKGRLVIQAPVAQETTLLKSLLAGRRSAISVVFQATETDTVSVTLWAHQYHASTAKKFIDE